VPESPEATGRGDEIDRLRAVYAEYVSSPDVLARWSSANPGIQAILAERTKGTRDLLSSHGFWPLEDVRILDVGCGTGRTLGQLRGWGARPGNLVGIDLFQDYIEVARAENPDIRFICGDAAAIPFGDASFDLVVGFTVFSSILDEGLAGAVASEIARVLRPQGAVLWYDFRVRNPGNPNVRGVGRTQIDSLFPGFTKDLVLVTVLPPVTRRLGRLAPRLYPALRLFRVLRTHYLALLIKPPG
jgi:SAM-dependent methyltransferase